MDLNIFLWLPDYCTVFQMEVMTIYWAAQRILVNGAIFTRISISQAAIKSRPNIRQGMPPLSRPSFWVLQ